jgi:NAD(P)-dependent dehydrogenase (short-subunit alcohol dehydrogenase family)
VESIRRFADHIRKKHGGLDILINNAAIAFKVA